MMELFSVSEMLKRDSHHYVSEYCFRIQVVKIKAGEARKDYYTPSGELLIFCLKGKGIVFTEKEKREFKEGDQVFVDDPFRIENCEDLAIEMIWSPGDHGPKPQKK